MDALERGGQQIFTVQDVARAAGARVAEVRAIVEASDLPAANERFFPLETAVELLLALRRPQDVGFARRRLFARGRGSARPRGPLAASGGLHLAALAVIVLGTGLGVRSAPEVSRATEPARLVFLATPGPGGGGGGGGLEQPKPPSAAALEGRSTMRSPVAVVERRKPPARAERRVETPPAALETVEPEPQPAPPAPAAPVVAPVASVPGDPVDRPGVLTDTAAVDASHGPGLGGGTGDGLGSGSGEGQGAGIGPGTTAGTGGGPYRPGSGITPPAIAREVKASYTEEGRRRGIEGDVLLEVIVKADGTVGAVRLIRGLGAGLDRRAVDAVEQWRFTPARRFGTPVDVIVEVAVEFRLR